jgi:hypothetical protein
MGGELDRLLDSAHAALGGAVTESLRRNGWEVRPEVSFSRWGERGVIDLLAWHPQTKTLLVIELKTAVVDLQELLGGVDRKVRLAPEIVRDFGWRPASVAVAVIVANGRTNRRRVQENASLIRAALPSDGRQLRHWLRAPLGPLRALAIWPKLPAMTGTRGPAVRRVRV